MIKCCWILKFLPEDWRKVSRFKLLFHVREPKLQKAWNLNLFDFTFMSIVSCQKGPTRHAYAWQIGPFWQDTLDVYLAMVSLEAMGDRFWGLCCIGHICKFVDCRDIQSDLYLCVCNFDRALNVSSIILTNQWVNTRKTEFHCQHTGVTSFLH